MLKDNILNLDMDILWFTQKKNVLFIFKYINKLFILNNF